jgi:hypothetical protein
MISAGAPDAALPAAAVALTPLFDDRHEPASSPDLEAELKSLWAGTRALDRAAGRTVNGPHRVDFDVHYAQKQMPAALGSTGEQKALLVGLILAHARLVALRTGITPFLLLDEIRDAVLIDGKWHSGSDHSETQHCMKMVEYDVNPNSPYAPAFKLSALAGTGPAGSNPLENRPKIAISFG